LYYKETVDWFDKNNLQYNHNIVTYPAWLSLNSMPVPIKNHLRDCSFIKNYCQITGQEVSTDEYLKQLQLQDTAKRISIETYMPELLALLTK